MKTCYDKWGKRGFSNNFIIKEFDSCTTNTLVDGSYIFKDIIFSEGEIHWDYPLDSLQIGYGMFQDCTSLTSFTVDLNSLTDGMYMFNNSGIVSFKQELNSLTNGKFMFYNCTALTDFSSDMNSLKGDSKNYVVAYMFKGCTNLKTFKGELKNLTYGYQMFYDCASLVNFTSDLSSLKNGFQMFMYCKSLAEFTTPLDNITSCYEMFRECQNLTKFEGDLSSITNGTGMFYNTKINGDVINNATFASLENGSTMFFGCKTLTSIRKDFPNLTNGNGMFMQCGPKEDDETIFGLSEFIGDLKSVTDGGFMFQGCENLRTFKSNLESLVTASSMFNDCGMLSNFVLSSSVSQTISTNNLKNLINGSSMFVGCFNLCEFEYDLSSIKNGYSMFRRCYGLTEKSENEKQEEGKPKPEFKTFKPNLANLLNGQYMFVDCRLDTETIKSIADTIKDVNGLKDGTTITDESGVSVGTIRRIIDICIDKDDPNSNEINYFKSMANKGWTVHVQKFIVWDEITKPKQFYGKYLEVPENAATHRLEIKNEKGEIIAVKFVILIGGSHVYGKTDGGEICSDDTATKIGYQKYINEADAITKLNLKAIKK